MTDFSTRLKALLKERKLSHHEFAFQLGVSTTTVSDWTRGRHKPREFQLECLCEFFKMSEAELMGEGVH